MYQNRNIRTFFKGRKVLRRQLLYIRGISGSSNVHFTSILHSETSDFNADEDGTETAADSVIDKARKVLSKHGTVYYDHVQTNWPQRTLLSVGSALMSIANPTRTDMVAALAETTGSNSLYKLYQKMASDPVGQEILRDKPIINGKTVDVNHLQSFPDGTLGKHYADFMINNGLSADTRSPVQFIEDTDLAYVMFRYRTIHDFVHILLGMGSVTVAAEVAVKWFEMVQTGLPMTMLSSTFGLYSNGISSSERRILVKKLVPWALLCGMNSKFMMNIYFEKHLERNLAELQAEAGVIPAPVVL